MWLSFQYDDFQENFIPHYVQNSWCGFHTNVHNSLSLHCSMTTMNIACCISDLFLNETWTCFQHFPLKKFILILNFCRILPLYLYFYAMVAFMSVSRITTVFRSVDLTALNLFSFARQFSAHALFLFFLSIISVYLCVSLNAICCLSTDTYWISSLQLFVRAHFPFSFAHIRFVVFFNIFNFYLNRSVWCNFVWRFLFVSDFVIVIKIRCA